LHADCPTIGGGVSWGNLEDSTMRLSTSGLITTLVLALLVIPRTAKAQQAASVAQIGLLTAGPFAPRLHMLEVFQQGLRELGWVEGHNITFVLRSAEGNAERLPAVTAELVHVPVDIIVAFGSLAAQAAKQTTSTIPIVVGVGDAVGAGLVPSLARPGGNITGVSDLAPELAEKRLALLKEAVPELGRVAILWNPTTPNTDKLAEHRVLQGAAQALNVMLQWVEVQADGDFERAFAAMMKERPDALITLDNTLTITHRTQIVAFAAKTRLPAMYPWRDFAEIGGLMAYGAKMAESWRRMAFYVDKILKGAKPADLPVEQPTKFELVINLKTAKELGLTLPPTLLFQADEVIR
jgi:putative ABC transport system substrate-binding protein